MTHPNEKTPAMDWRWSIPVILVGIALFAEPVGYIGGGASDDDRYVDAALCWLEKPCLPKDHWQARWPVNWSIATSVKLFGFTRVAVGLPTIIASLASLWLMKWLGDRLFGPPAGLAAACILALIPTFTIQFMSPAADPLETAAILGGFALLLGRHAILAGLSFGIAVAVRETALTAMVPALILCWKRPRDAATLLAGFAIVPLAEVLAYLAVTGDPFYRYGLSLGHTLIPTEQLAGGVGAGLPIFNADNIANWRRDLALHVHWSIDGLLNLLPHPKSGLIYILALLVTARRIRLLSSSERTRVLGLMGFAALWTLAMVYCFAVDPKPRAMIPAMASLSLVVGAIVVRRPDPVVFAALACAFVIATLSYRSHTRQAAWERDARILVARYPGQIETHQQRYYRFTPELQQLPPIGSGLPMLMVLKDASCNVAAEEDPMRLQRLYVEREMTGNKLAYLLGQPTRLCLFRYTRK